MIVWMCQIERRLETTWWPFWALLSPVTSRLPLTTMSILSRSGGIFPYLMLIYVWLILVSRSNWKKNSRGNIVTFLGSGLSRGLEVPTAMTVNTVKARWEQQESRPARKKRSRAISVHSSYVCQKRLTRFEEYVEMLKISFCLLMIVFVSPTEVQGLAAVLKLITSVIEFLEEWGYVAGKDKSNNNIAPIGCVS